MRPEAARALVFDLDGTLVDSRLDLAAAVNRTRADLGLPPLGLPAALGMVGQGARNLVRRALGGEVDSERLDRAVELFLAHYEPICVARTLPYEGLSELLAELAGAKPLALLTNKPERPARRILEHFGWTAWFGAVIGGDGPLARKPAPDGLLALAGVFGVEPRELILVGDSRIDADTAVAAGASFVLCEWGFAPATELEEISADWRVRDARELRRLLTGRAIA